MVSGEETLFTIKTDFVTGWGIKLSVREEKSMILLTKKIIKSSYFCTFSFQNRELNCMHFLVCTYLSLVLKKKNKFKRYVVNKIKIVINNKRNSQRQRNTQVVMVK